MLATIATYANNRLTPVQYPEDARWTAGRFDVNLTLARGTVVAAKAATPTLLVAYDDVTNVAAAGFLMYDIKTDANGMVYYGGSTTASPENVPMETAPFYVNGTFDPAELTGLTAAGKTALKARTLQNGFVQI